MACPDIGKGYVGTSVFSQFSRLNSANIKDLTTIWLQSPY